LPKTSHLSERDSRLKHPASGVRPSPVPGLLLGLGVLVVFVAILAIIFTPHSSAQGNSGNGESAFAKKADKMLHLVRKAHAHDLIQQRVGQPARGKSRLEALSKTVGVHRKIDGTATVDVAVKLTGESAEELHAAGFRVGARAGDMLTLQVDLARLDELASLSSVEKISAAVRRYPTNDRAQQASGVEETAGQRLVPQTGQGVVVAIIDTGIDFRHADFTVPGSGGRQTRIKALLDMTLYGAQAPDPGWNYVLPGQSATIGHLYTEADLNAALQLAKPANQNADIVKQRDKNGHGTHVASTAAGNGLSSPIVGTYNGIAPEADLIVIKASRENNGDDGFLTTDIINALQFVQQKAAELNKPFVINLSLGGQLGPHDGTTPDERAIDNLVNSGAGRAVCVAAGNEGDSSIHARGTVPAGGSLTLDFNVNGAAFVVDLYQKNSDRFRVTVTSPNGIPLGPVAYDANGFSLPNGQAANEYLSLYNANDDKGDSDPSNDQPDIVLLFNPGAPNGMWKIKLEDADANPNQEFDAWSEGVGIYFSTNADSHSHLVGSPGTARRAITVGAFVTRSASLTLGSSALFSSPGPTADERQKPEISAPGHYLYSARSTDAASNFGTIGTGENAPTDATHYTGLSGTSMATPVATGAVALLLQSNLNLAGDEIKNRLTSYTDKDFFTGTQAWHPRMGFGKLNIFNSINQSGGGLRRYSIGGRLTNQDGSGVGNMQMWLSGTSSAVVVTDAGGNYTIPNLVAGGTYTIQPSYQGPQVSYTPSFVTYTGLYSDKIANFVRVLAVNVTISGRLTDTAGNGIAGIQVWPRGVPYLPGNTDNNGYYSIEVPTGSNVTIEPTSILHSFIPVSTAFTNVTTNQTANFVGQRIVQPALVEFASGPFNFFEDAGTAVVSIIRNGDTSTLVTATYETVGAAEIRNCAQVQGGAVARCDFAAAFGTVTFAPGETEKTISIPLVDDAYAEGLEAFLLKLTSCTNSTLGTRIYATVWIGDNEPINGPNPITQTDFFVRQHYIDFLGREPDPAGFTGWQNVINNCAPGDIACDRIHVSRNFYQSPEFQQRGYFVYRFYPVSFGRKPDYAEFVPDLARVSGFLNDAQLEAAKVAFVNDFMARPIFASTYNSLNDTQYVDALIATAGVTLTNRQALIDALSAGTKTRAQVLREIVEGSEVSQKYFNQAFVVMQYFGYLRRDPDVFYLDWIQVLNTTGDSRGMINGFVNSLEYRLRFGP